MIEITLHVWMLHAAVFAVAAGIWAYQIATL